MIRLSRSEKALSKQHRGLTRSLVLTAVAALTAAGAATALGAPAPILDPTGIRFQMTTEGQRWVLTISGPGGFHVRDEFEGSPPASSLVGEDSEAPADGTYIWELRRQDSDQALVSSGAFHVRAGRPLISTGPPAVERPQSPVGLGTQAPTSLAPTHFGNVSIDGRLCVGDGCDETVPIPFEAIKMLQNNSWIRIVDDSGVTFPGNDWQIKFNDSFSKASGGSDYFGIEDLGLDGSTTAVPLRVDAGAPTDSIRVSQLGRVGLGTATPGATLQVAGDAIVDGDFTAGSSRDIKHAFAPIEPRVVLERLIALPISEWSYRSGSRNARHMGPVSEDFSAAFGLGRDDRHVSPVDLSGVAFAAIQGLHEIVRERDARIEALEASRAELAARLVSIEARLEATAAAE